MMDDKYLYINSEYRRSPIYYIDKECTQRYTGHVEDYFNGVLCWECDMVNGLREGIEKVYYEETGELEQINQVEDNVCKGLGIEFYKSGQISSISLFSNDIPMDYYIYSEDGKLEKEYIYKGEIISGIIHTFREKSEIVELRKKIDLSKIHDEITKYGKILDIDRLFTKE